jgi:hypothetical protein
VNTPPRKQSETGLYAPVWRELNRVIDYMREISPTGGRNISERRTLNGTLTTTEPAISRGVELKAYQIVSIENDFYSCLAWTGSATTGDEVYIARPFEHMVSNWNGRSIAYDSDGDAFTATYSYTSATKRTKTIAGTAETQVLTPYFMASDQLIYAMKFSGVITVGAAFTPLTDPNDNPITLVDMNRDGRAWTSQ